MSIVSRTVYGAALQSAIYMGKPHQVQENSTLNEKFGIQVNVLPSNDERHAVRYYCIGSGGHRAVIGADGVAYITPNRHEATDAACFRHLPFVLREVTDDLTTEQRAKYGLRRQETHDGREYFAYYAKRLDLDTAEVNLQRTRVDGNNQTSEPFVPTNANLNPQPLVSGDDDNVIEASGEYVSGSIVVTIDFNEADAEELRNAARILYGDEKYAVISELALVGGIRRVVTGPGAGNNEINYDEIIAAQVTTFISAYYQLNVQNNGFSFTADLGITEPLYATTVE